MGNIQKYERFYPLTLSADVDVRAHAEEFGYSQMGIIISRGSLDTEDVVILPAGGNLEITLNLRVGIIHKIGIATVMSTASGTTSETIHIVGV